MSLEFIPKSITRCLKYLFLTYAILNIVYMSIHFYTLSNEPHTRTRRSITVEKPLKMNQVAIQQEVIYHPENSNISSSRFCDP
jgi:hypothetical protein